MSISYPVHPTCPRNKNIYQSQNKLRSLGKDEQQAFWQKLKEAKGTKGLTKVIEEVATRNHFEQSVSVGKREYLPLGVWAKKGYPVDKIKEANDVRNDPVLGEVYGAVLKSIISEEGDRNEFYSKVGGSSAAAGGHGGESINNRISWRCKGNGKGNGKGKGKGKCKGNANAEREAMKNKKAASILATHALTKITPVVELIKIKKANKYYNDLPKMPRDTVEGHAATLDKYLKSAYAHLKEKGKLTFDLVDLNQNVADARKALDFLDSMLTSAKEFSQMRKPIKGTVAKGNGKRTLRATDAV